VVDYFHIAMKKVARGSCGAAAFGNPAALAHGSLGFVSKRLLQEEVPTVWAKHRGFLLVGAADEGVGTTFETKLSVFVV